MLTRKNTGFCIWFSGGMLPGLVLLGGYYYHQDLPSFGPSPNHGTMFVAYVAYMASLVIAVIMVLAGIAISLSSPRKAGVKGPYGSTMIFESGSTNPYASPPLLVDECGPHEGLGQDLKVNLAAKSWAYRRLCVFGACHAVIEYDGYWPLDTVAVNGVVVSRKTGWQGYAPRHDFEVPGDSGLMAARVDVKLSWGVVLSGFRLWIGDHVIYSEGIWTA